MSVAMLCNAKRTRDVNAIFVYFEGRAPRVGQRAINDASLFGAGVQGPSCQGYRNVIRHSDSHSLSRGFDANKVPGWNELRYSRHRPFLLRFVFHHWPFPVLRLPIFALGVAGHNGSLHLRHSHQVYRNSKVLFYRKTIGFPTTCS